MSWPAQASQHTRQASATIPAAPRYFPVTSCSPAQAESTNECVDGLCINTLIRGPCANWSSCLDQLTELHQNTSFAAICITRPVFEEVMRPNAELENELFGFDRFGWFNVLNVSQRNSRCLVSPRGTFL
jgi:hypothetical protein